MDSVLSRYGTLRSLDLPQAELQFHYERHDIQRRSNWTMGLRQEPMDTMESSATYPAPTKQAAVEINGVKTDAMSMSFSDKIMITITQGGRLAQWVSVSQSIPCEFLTQDRSQCHSCRTIQQTQTPISRLLDRTRTLYSHRLASSLALSSAQAHPIER